MKFVVAAAGTSEWSAALSGAEEGEQAHRVVPGEAEAPSTKDSARSDRAACQAFEDNPFGSSGSGQECMAHVSVVETSSGDGDSCDTSRADDGSSEAGTTGNVDEWNAMLARLYELMDQRNALNPILKEICSETIENGRRIEREEDEIDALGRQILEAEASRRRLRPGTDRRSFNLIRSNLRTRLRMLVKGHKALKKRTDKGRRRLDQVKEALTNIDITFCEHQRVMASNNGEQYMQLLERAYKAKRCAHCLSNASKKKEGIATTKRCSSCKAVHYCNEDCQAGDWDVHQRLCRNLKERRNERIAKWYEKDKMQREFAERMNCGWYGEGSGVIGVPGSVDPVIANELLGFDVYDADAEESDGDDGCCTTGCTIG